jgi:photosystem II stability/assembly factor-like uncharacterized protein
MSMHSRKETCFMGRLNLITFVFLSIVLLFSGCETPGDKFPRFEVKETLLGQIRNHPLKKAYFLNSTSGYIAISKDTILKTEDGGKTFNRVLADTSASFEDIDFVDEKEGFIADRNNNLFRTLDGGVSWDKVPVGIAGTVIRDLKCIDSDTLLIAAGGDPMSEYGYIFRSTDKGNSWDTIQTLNLINLFFLDKKTGYACGFNGIEKTSDAGRTWDTIASTPFEHILFFNENIGFASLKRSLFSTSDGGKNWKLVKTIVNPHWIVGEDFSKIECLYALGSKDLLFTLNSRIIKVTHEMKWYQYEFTRPYYQLQMIGTETGIAYGFENLILLNF